MVDSPMQTAAIEHIYRTRCICYAYIFSSIVISIHQHASKAIDATATATSTSTGFGAISHAIILRATTSQPKAGRTSLRRTTT